ncbi:DCD (Development and Cell Death) domain protein [Zea mays]|uniref:DCD (Development and Cell Death) domain protein n=1 Tax=Zea mays TaxID=4577 RepID=A0A1D6NMV4_MAIZE|nr:DCD (Development and Cell Death) domain protein [Zea mays]
MEGYDREFYQFSDQLRLQTAAFSGLSLGDSIWSPAGRRNNSNDVLFAASASPADAAAKSNAVVGLKLNDGGPGLIGSGKLAFGGGAGGGGTNKADRYNNNNLPNTDNKTVYNTSSSSFMGNGSSYAKNNNNNADMLAFDKMGSYGYNGGGNTNNNSNEGRRRGVRQEEARQERGRGGGHGQAAVQDAAGVGGAAAGPGHRRVHLRLQQRHYGREPQEGAVRAAVQVQGLCACYPPGTAPLPLQLLHAPAPRHLRGRELRRDQHRPDGVGGQEVPRRVALSCAGAGGNAEDLRPAGGGRLPPHPAPLRRAQVPARALRHRGPRPPRHLRRQGRRLIPIGSVVGPLEARMHE